MNPPAPRQERPRIRVLVTATHVGTSLFTGHMHRMLTDLDPDLVLATELQAPRVRLQAARVFPVRQWVRGGFLPPSTGRGSSGTLAFARRARFRKVSQGNPLVSRYLDPMHPTRRTTVLRVNDRETGRDLTVSPPHTWTLALGPNLRPQWRPHIREQHMLQLDRYRAAARAALTRGDDVILGGDVNEWVTGDGRTPVETKLDLAGLRHYRTDEHRRLIEAWGSLELSGLRIIDADEAGADHVALLLTLRCRG